jgi:hypothetical protein
MDVLTKKVKEEPLLFTFLGLTVAALGGGLRSLATGDNRSSQTMMRARVFFQLCTVCTLVGTVYWKAYTGDTSAWVGVAACAAPARAPSRLGALSHLSPAFPLSAVMGRSRPAGAELPAYLTDLRTADALEVWEINSRSSAAAAAASLR